MRRTVLGTRLPIFRSLRRGRGALTALTVAALAATVFQAPSSDAATAGRTGSITSRAVSLTPARQLPDRKNAEVIASRTPKIIKPAPAKAGPAPAGLCVPSVRRPGGLYLLDAAPVVTDAKGRLTGPELPAPASSEGRTHRAEPAAHPPVVDCPKAPAGKAKAPKAGKNADSGKAAQTAQSGATPGAVVAGQNVAVTPAAATVPGAPTTVTGVSQNAAVKVTWKDPSSNGGATITSYKVTASPGGKTATASGATATTATVTGLTNGTSYTFTVTATNSVGTSKASTASAAVVPATVPGAPTSAAGVAQNAAVKVTWADPSSNGGSAITSYKVTSSPGGKTATVTGATATTATVTGLTNGTAYTFTVTATNAAGTGAASAASAAVTPVTVPGAPTGVIGVAQNGAVKVTWADPSTNGGTAITSYQVTASPGGATATATGATATTATVTGLTNGTAYTFTVTALNAAGTGTASSASSPVTPAAAPGAPTGVTGLVRDEAVTVSWTAPASDGGSPITSYTVTASNSGGSKTVNSPATTAEISGLDNGTAYTFTVTAKNAIGSSPASAASAAVTPVAATKPGPVTNVQVVPGNAQATISWTNPASDGGADIVEAYITVLTADGDYVGTTSVSAPATSAVVTGLTDGASYTAEVEVDNRSYYNSAEVASAVFTPKAGPQPAPPATVGAHPGTAQATVTWTAPTDDGGSPVTGYTVTAYAYSNDAVVGTPVVAGASATSAMVTGLTNGTSYYFGVSASNANGAGPKLFTDTVTPAGAPGAPTSVAAYPSSGGLFATWSAPSANGGSTVTQYTVTVSTSAGPVAQVTSSAPAAQVGGLPNYNAYTVTVVAANAVTPGPASSPSAAVTPSAQNVAPSGLAQLPPAVTLAAPNGGYDSTFSGDGRFIVYDQQFTLPDGYTRVYGIFRYDTVTGQKINVAVDGSGNPYRDVSIQSGSDGALYAGVSDDGNLVAFVRSADTDEGYSENVYLRDVSAGTTTLVSRNAAGGPTVGSVKRLQVSADGSSVVFLEEDATDMAGKPSCSDTGLYRYSVAGGSVAYLDVTPASPGIAGVTAIGCSYPDQYDDFAISASGGTVAVSTDVQYTCACASTESDSQIVIVTAGSGGSASAKWYAALDSLKVDLGITYLAGPSYYWLKMSYDGSTVVAELDDSYVGASYPGFPLGSLVSIGTASMTAVPYGVHPMPIRNDSWITGLSGDGRIAILSIFLYGPSGDSRNETLAMDVSSGSMALLSQAGGTMGDGSSQSNNGGIDAAGDRVLIDTDSQVLLGIPPGSHTTSPANAVVVGLSDLPLFLAGGNLGCDCGNSLAQSAPLQNYVGDPVNTATGAFTESAEDGGVPAPGVSFAFQRGYNSGNTVAGPLGRGWTMPYGMSLTTAANGDATVTVEDGSKGVFRKQPDGAFHSAPGVDSILTATASGYTLTLPSHQTDVFNAAGQLASTADASGQGLTFHYTGTQLTSVTDAAGRSNTLTYDPTSGRLTSVALSDGRSISYGYNTAGLLSTVTGVDGKTTTYGYDSGNRLTTITDPAGHVVTANTYDGTSGRVTQQATDAGADTGHLAWDASTQAATYTAPGGGVSKDYYSGNVLLRHIDADGGETDYTYDAHLDVTSVTDPDGHTTTMSYDPAGRILTRTAPAPLNYTESWTYDAAGNVLTYTDGRGKTTTSVYDTSNRLKQTTDAAGAKTAYTYTAAGQTETVTDPDGGVAHYAYDTAGNLVSATDAAGAVTTATYDASGREHTQTSPRGNLGGADPAAFTTTYTYDPHGHVLTETDPLGHLTKFTYDDAGNVSDWTDPAGAKTSYTHDAAGDVLTSTDALSHVTRYTYDADGHQNSVTDPAGGKTTRVYDPAGRLASAVSPRGNASGANPAAFTTTYAYDGEGRTTSVTDPLGHVTKAGYDAAGRRVSTTDPLNRTTVTGYDADGNVILVTDPAGGKTSTAYDDAGHAATVTDELGHVTALSTDPAGLLLSSTSPLGEKTTFTYFPDGRRHTETDPRGNVSGADPAAFTTTYAYDVEGHTTKTTDPLGGATSATYDAVGDRLTTTDPAAGVTHYGYDADGRPSSTTDPLGHAGATEYTVTGLPATETDATGAQTTYTYDAAGRRLTMTTPDGNVAGATRADFTTTYGYDPDGDLTTVTGPTGAVTTTGYDGADRPVTVTDADGFTTTTAYDPAGQTSSVTDPLGAATSSTYDGAGRVLTSTEPGGAETDFGYDAAGHLTSRKSPLGEKATWTFDADGRTASATTARGNASGADPAAFTTEFGYDKAGNQTSATDPLGDVTALAYDADDRTVSSTDPAGDATVYGYDPAGRLTLVTSPAGEVTKYVVDAAGNTTSRTDANGHTTGFGFDADNRPTSVTDALGGQVSAGYDPSGNRTTVTDARGIVASTGYDGRGLPTTVGYSDTTPTVTYSYDPDGRMTGQHDGTGDHTLGYDKDGHLTSVSEPTGGSFGYTYDPAGRVSTRTYPDGRATSYTYNGDGEQATQTTGGATTTYGYNADGLLASTTLPAGNGDVETRGYDPDGKLTSISASNGTTTLSSFTVTRNADGQPSSVAADRAGTIGTQYYTYDKDSRLTSSCTVSSCPAGPGTTAYTYDAVGNRLTQTAGGTATTYAYNAADEQTSATTGATVVNSTYDADGNYTGDGTATNVIAYNAVNKPATATQGTNHYIFTYDAQGNRVVTSANGTVVRTSLWDTNNALPQLATDTGTGGALIADYAYDPDGAPQAETTASGAFYATHDWLDSVTDLTDAAGVDQLRNSYSATGAETTNTLAPTPPPNTFGFAGQPNDPALPGLQDLRAREYDPATGVFTGRDPLAQPATDPYTSAYAYAEDDPTTLTDPSGQTPGASKPWVPSGSYEGGSKGRHDFAVGMAYTQLVGRFGATKVYADLGAAFYGPIGQLLQLPGTGRNGGLGEPDLAVKDAPIPTAPSGTGWWLYEVKPATQAGATGTTYGKGDDAKVYNGDAALAQLGGYLRAMKVAYPGAAVEPGRPIVPESAIYPADGTIETIFSRDMWNTYGTAFEDPVAENMDGLIFYTNFKLTRNKQGVRSKAYPKALPAIKLLIQQSGSQLSVDDFLRQLMDPSSTATCKTGPDGLPTWVLPTVGGVGAFGAAGYLGYQAWTNRTPSWLSDEALEQFLERQGVSVSELTSAAEGAAELSELSELLEVAEVAEVL